MSLLRSGTTSGFCKLLILLDKLAQPMSDSEICDVSPSIENRGPVTDLKWPRLAKSARGKFESITFFTVDGCGEYTVQILSFVYSACVHATESAIAKTPLRNTKKRPVLRISSF